MRKSYSKKIKGLSVVLAANLIVQAIGTNIAFALTSGPQSPEFSSFTPVATSDMVDVFSGSFNYNIPIIEVPGPHGGGYAMSLSYTSGVTAEQEASWVGLGWTLNPGTISRGLQGFPDDYSSQSVIGYNKSRPTWSASGSASLGLEIFSKDTSPSGSESTSNNSSQGDAGSGSSVSKGGLDLRFTKNFHNYTGYHYSTGVGLGYSFARLELNVDDNGVTFRPAIDAVQALGMAKKAFKKNKKQSQAASEPEIRSKIEEQKRTNAHSLKFQTQRMKAGLSAPSILNNAFNTYVLDAPHIPRTGFSNQVMDGFAFNWSNSIQVNAFGPVGIEAGMLGAFNSNFIKPENRKKAYQVKGYLYTPQVPQKENRYLLDYSEERGQALGNFDKYLGIPLPNYDVFSVSGEGIMGNFHAYPKQIGNLGPNYTKSESEIYQLGLELGVGTTLQVGVDLGIGKQTTKLMSWFDGSHAIEGANSTYEYQNHEIQYKIDRNEAFRFDGDMGGALEYQTTSFDVTGVEDMNQEVLNTARVRKASPIPGFKFPYLEDRNVYRLNPDIAKTPTNPQKSSHIKPIYASDNLLTGYHLTKSDGILYQYDYPVYVKNETSLSVNIGNDYLIEDRNIATRNDGLKLMVNANGDYAMDDAAFTTDNYHTTVVGQVNNNKYARNFLLTGIISPSYIDAGPPGLDDQDFGGWTKFTYQKAYGEGESDWYRYRIPYYGLQYQQNSISDTQDDLGAVSTGQKEVVYLQSIETATHIAYFITNKTDGSSIHAALKGSGNIRKDELGAVEPTSTHDPAADSKEKAVGTADLEYLEKIVLFKKSKQAHTQTLELIKTVRFAYDYSLVPETPNSLTVGGNSLGKLTLKRIWFEYNGVVEAQISPYTFEYQYDNPERIISGSDRMYIPIFSEIAKLFDENVDQNPAYKLREKDSWGQTTPIREIRKSNGITWPDQRALHETAFDPAIYHLKKIGLPSGGEIHVQYEAKDYAYVQNRPAMTMATISESNNSDVFTVDPKELGLLRTEFAEGTEGDLAYTNALNSLLQKVNTYFITEGNRIYYKVLYGLKGSTTPTLDNCKSDFIIGYAKVKETLLENGRIKVVLDNENAQNGQRAQLPREACIEFVVNQRQGKLERTDCIEPELEAEFDAYIREAANSGSKGDIAKKIPGALKGLIDGIGEGYKYNESSLCLRINYDLSFLRLPVYKAKIAGGSRVKRLLMYDAFGLEALATSLYGTEYHYEMRDGSSSGVATNEPPASKEENPLYQPLDQLKQTTLNRWLVGENLEQLEGPLGEGLLPAASIGYRRVVVSNIFKGSSSPGHSTYQYFTSFDYPYDRVYAHANDLGDYTGDAVRSTDINDNRVKDRLMLNFGLINIGLTKLFASQGYLFVQNNMHGKLKEVATFAGPYLSDKQQIANRISPTSFTRYEYYEPGEKVRVYAHEESGIRESWYVPGKEMEVARSGKKMKDSTFDFSLELDINIDLSTGIPPKIYPSFFASLGIYDNAVAAHSTTKIIRYPSIVKRVTSFQEGISRTTDNLAFNKQTGSVILTATYDSYHAKKLNRQGMHDGTIFNFSLPTSWLYPALGPKSVNINNSNQLEGSAVQITTYGKSPIDLTIPVDTDVETSKPFDLSKVLQASIQTYTNGWNTRLTNSTVADEYGIRDNNPVLTAFGKKYLAYKNFTYKAEDLAKGATYSSGYFQIPQLPDWKNPGADWLMVSQTTLYSPHSEPLEEVNALGIASSAKFGKAYGYNLPIMMSNNANYAHTYFTSFEYEEQTEGPVAHAGNSCHTLTPDSPVEFHIQEASTLYDGAVLYAWFNHGLNNKTSKPVLSLGGTIYDSPPAEVAVIGEWHLLKWVLPNSLFIENSVQVQISNSGTETLYLDDVRFQPLQAQATCYVYDPVTFRLLTQFDDQHFGLYYQYDQEGKLLRKQVETERGKMTIQETYYNTPKVSR